MELTERTQVLATTNTRERELAGLLEHLSTRAAETTKMISVDPAEAVVEDMAELVEAEVLAKMDGVKETTVTTDAAEAEVGEADTELLAGKVLGEACPVAEEEEAEDTEIREGMANLHLLDRAADMVVEEDMPEVIQNKVMEEAPGTTETRFIKLNLESV